MYGVPAMAVGSGPLVIVGGRIGMKAVIESGPGVLKRGTFAVRLAPEVASKGARPAVTLAMVHVTPELAG